MDIPKGKKHFILFSWAVIVLPSLFITYHFFPPQIDNIYTVLSLFVFATLMATVPIVINGTPVFLIQWLSIVALVRYGLFLEIVLMQFAIIPLLLRIRVTKSEWYRFPLNSTMFFFVSLISGLVYIQVGGEFGEQPLNSVFIPILIYQVVSVLVNQCVLVLVYRFLNRDYKFISDDLQFDFISNMVMFPLSLALYYLSGGLGFLAIIFIGIPFITVSIILRRYNATEKINHYLQKAVEIGHQLTESLQVNEVLELFIKKITATLPVDYAYILDVQDDHLVLLRRVEKGMKQPNSIPPIQKGEGISGLVWRTGVSTLYRTKSEWVDIVQGYMPEDVESVICVPIVRSQKVRGILLLASTKKRAYEKYQLMIVDMLCSYFGVAIENARHYEKTKLNSELCGLTKLYNYRYFEEILFEEFNHLQVGKRQCLSLIMLDIDHFKSVNDTYGHQSGNEILTELAQRLKRIIGSRGTVARYGGEEFVILLPNIIRSDAMDVAEDIRIGIAEYPFILHSDLDLERRELMVTITASIGVASAPEDADDALALIRHADRALYTGAKQAGRNRVAQYVKS